MRKFACVLSLLFLTSACSTLLPKARTDTTTFKSYDEARDAIDALVPNKSDRETLEKNGFSLKKHPNMTLLTHLDVMRRFLPTGLLRREDLDPGVLNCLESRDSCTGVEIIGTKIASERKGNFFADFFNFDRRTETTGWRFNAIVLFVNDVVVYRSTSGQPNVNEVQESHNPLGPFQDIGPSVVPQPVTVR
jgi:hypothetical protein